VLGQHALQAGERTTLEVTYKTEGFPGDFVKKVFLTTDIPGEETVEIFTIRGHVLEAPSAKIAVDPRRVTIEGAERDTGRKQSFAITNEGQLPLEITRIYSKDGSKVYFDGAECGNLVVGPGRTESVEIELEPEGGTEQVQKLVLFECNARNAGQTGYFIIVRYSKR